MGLFDQLATNVGTFVQSPEGGNMLSDLGAGLLTGNNWKQGFSNAGQRAIALAPERQQQAKANQQASMTQAWIEANRPDLLPLLEAGATPVEVLSTAMSEQQAERQRAAEQQQRQQYAQLITDPNLSQMVAAGAMDFESAYKYQQGGGESGRSIGLAPQWAVDPNTNQAVLGQMADDGTFVPTEMGGLQPMDPRTLYSERAAGTAFGKGQGGAVLDLPQAEWIAGETTREIEELRNHPGLDEEFGPVGGVSVMGMGIPGQVAPDWPGSNKAAFRRRKEQLVGRNFLAAYETLRGGGQITEVEGRKAEQAMARLDTATTKAEFLQALDDFEQAVRDGVTKLAQQSTMSPYGAPAQSSAPIGGDLTTMSDEQLLQQLGM